MVINDLLQTLLNRLPELEWQLNKLGTEFSARLLPPGLFQLPIDASKSDYIDQLRNDIKRVSHQKDIKSIHFLVEKINQKINVLVQICCSRPRDTISKDITLTINKLSTRQGWLNDLEQMTQVLNEQKKALISALSETTNQEIKMSLHYEIGLLERKLTLNHEAYYQATGYYLNKDKVCIKVD